MKDDQGQRINFEKCGMLSDRTRYLKQHNLIIEEIFEWSNFVRIEGNKAVHEGQSSIEESDECLEFVNLFCDIVFTLPALIKEKKSTHPNQSRDG
ncbi:DUF4145 domain-containing protein [Candidatus Liberibacter asiaticus]|uniref:DUF4145 domain-containing protein n=3 Tax=Liberibacter asiaticus TaxID=34021 RepID=C6XH02_LIBAP|nr:DUF4145 domain-containing protein [Candidatus Liberibacter asiaticus]ACT57655.1 hypothetical protein CLIBASIA_05445 [Candidatus Liberibacter asiaticus str. psy62]BAP26949.1 hypothetical protein CGUJ_05445 [Candidatus Liberibacter asiaticus str. Ishi-1]AGH17415.1 hypothetical protein WSI_05290 [Candidatus Liberibacter asiaticus str. gxpsy]ALK07689.1 DUF4145 domain-containing protein [Candidatus Liberibacter asiaticus]ASK53184.1 hypothetical protein B2I23_05355 [Candidatus Liberibacter asiati